MTEDSQRTDAAPNVDAAIPTPPAESAPPPSETGEAPPPAEPTAQAAPAVQTQTPVAASVGSVDDEVAKEMEAAGGSMDAILNAPADDRMPDASSESPKASGADAPATEEPTSAPAPNAAGEPEHYEMRRGRITAVRGDDVFVDLTGETRKLQGVVPLPQFDRPPRIGSIMDFVVEREDESQGLIFLSREGAVSRSTWDHLQKGSVVEARVVSTNKGGLELEIIGGIKAFMPASQIDVHPVGDLEPFIGQKLDGCVQEIDHRHKKVVLSRRAHIEAMRKRNRVKLLAEIKVGDIREGTVSNLTDFGAFIDIGGMDGLVHISDIAYERINKPSDVLKKGQSVRVKVLKIEPGKDRMSLGIKQADPDPWEGVDQEFTVGNQVSGKVTRTAPFGAFIEVRPGVEGLLPIAEISWKRIHKVEDVLQVGQIVNVQILEVQFKRKRMTLSLKQAAGDPWADAEATYVKGSRHEGKVVNLTDFGAFVELKQGVEGLVHISELSDKRVGKVSDVLNVGDVKTFRVKDIDPGKRKLSLSLKEQKEEPVLEPETSRKPKPKVDKSKLTGGMDLSRYGGTGLGGLSLDDLK